MINEKDFVPRSPDLKGFLEVAGWIHQDENGQKEIKIKIGNSVTLRKHIPKPKEPEVIDI